MLLLAVDTAGKKGSIAIAEARAGEASLELLELVPLDGGAFSAHLVPEIAALLQKHGRGRTKHDISAFIVVTGPGSFTGLRVGLAAIKALAETLNKPIVGISLLEAIARSSAKTGRSIVILDAGRSDLYVGEYLIVDHASASPISERLMTRKEFLDRVHTSDSRPLGVISSDEVLAKSFSSEGLLVRLVTYPNAGVIAQLGMERLGRGEIVSVGDLEPNYLRHNVASLPKDSLSKDLLPKDHSK